MEEKYECDQEIYRFLRRQLRGMSDQNRENVSVPSESGNLPWSKIPYVIKEVYLGLLFFEKNIINKI